MEKYETLGKRIAALLIDSILLGAGNLVNWIVIVMLGAANDRLVLILIAATNLACVFYFILLHALYGQTLGKKILKIKVVSKSGAPLSFGQSILRSLPLLIPALFTVTLISSEPTLDLATKIISFAIVAIVTSFLIIDLGVFVINEKRRALHDLIAGTIVVRTDV